MANEKRLIDANELTKLMCRACNNECCEEPCEPGECFIYDAVDNAPTVDAVEVVHGYWYAHHGITICSHCQAMFDADLVMLQIPSTWKMPNYCPNCGAKMDGDGNEKPR